MNGVIYARYSCDRQSERSIEGQLEDCTHFAADHGIRITREYIDRAKTGRNDDREGFQAMLSDAQAGLFDCLIAWKVDRLGRNRQELAINKMILQKAGVKILYAKEHIPETPEGVILESVMEGLAEYYSLDLAQKVRRGMRANAEQCKYNGAVVPYGYTIGADKEYLIDPVEGPIAKRIFQMYDAGSAFVDIARTLNHDGLRRRNGKTWESRGMRGILESDRYIGVYQFGDTRIEDGIPAIIDHDTWARVQRRLQLSKRKKHRNQTNLKYMLSGRVFCADCRRVYIADSGTSHTGTSYPYYTCEGKKNRKGCSAKSIPREDLEQFVVDKAMAIVYDDALVHTIAERAVATQKAEDTEKTKQSLIAQKKEAQKGISGIMAAIEAGIITPTTKSRLMELEDRVAEMDDAITELDIKFPPISVEFVEYFLKSFRGWEEDEKSRRELLHTLVNSVLIDGDIITVIFNYTKKRTEDNDPVLGSCSAEMVVHDFLHSNYPQIITPGYFGFSYVYAA